MNRLRGGLVFVFLLLASQVAVAQTAIEVSVGDRSLEVEWNPRAGVSDYKVCIAPDSAFQTGSATVRADSFANDCLAINPQHSTVAVVTAGSGRQSHTFDDLQNGVDYRVAVTAITNAEFAIHATFGPDNEFRFRPNPPDLVTLTTDKKDEYTEGTDATYHSNREIRNRADDGDQCQCARGRRRRRAVFRGER